MLSINFYWQLTTNKNGLNLYIFDSFSRVVLVRVAKIAKNSLELEVAEPKDIFREIARLELPA